jgi:uncharacterized protein (DUF1697 family)
MSRTAFLLRGINVGGRHPLAMARLRELATALGHEEVTTYVQSGNVVSVVPGTGPEAAAAALADALEAELGHAVPVVARTHEELRSVDASDPFDRRATDPSRSTVTFLDRPVEPAWFADLDLPAYAPDELALGDREIHLWTPDGQHASKLVRAATARLDGPWTTRNRKTVARLVAMTA